MPEQFVQGQTYEILVTYNIPSSCYQFNDFIYEIDGHERTIAVVNTVYNDSSCILETESVTVGFDFMVSGTDTYLFKFFQGEDEAGEDQYYLVEVPVVSNRILKITLSIINSETNVSLEQLIKNCNKKDAKAQSQLYELYASKLFSLCLKYSKNYAEAEDNLA